MLQMTVDQLKRHGSTDPAPTLNEACVALVRLDRMKALAKRARLALADHDLRLVRNLLMLIEAT